MSKHSPCWDEVTPAPLLLLVLGIIAGVLEVYSYLTSRGRQSVLASLERVLDRSGTDKTPPTVEEVLSVFHTGWNKKIRHI